MYKEKQCILIADDEVRIVRALRDLLAASGFHVLTAENGRDEQCGSSAGSRLTYCCWMS